MTSYTIADIDDVVEHAGKEKMAAPTYVRPPHDESTVWSIQSDTANRPFRRTIHYDVAARRVVDEDRFEDRHWIDRAVGQGIALHEGARFGLFNQLLALFCDSEFVCAKLDFHSNVATQESNRTWRSST